MRAPFLLLLLLAIVTTQPLAATPPPARVLANTPSEAEWDSAHELSLKIAVGTHVWCSAVDNADADTAGDWITVLVGGADSKIAVTRYARSTRMIYLVATLGTDTILPDFTPAVLSKIGEPTARNLAQLFWSRLIHEDMMAEREDADGYIVARAIAARASGLMREEAIRARLIK